MVFGEGLGWRGTVVRWWRGKGWNNEVMSRMMSVKEGRWGSVWEARQNTFFNNEFTDELMLSSYVWACDTRCVCACVRVCDASSDHHGSEVPLSQSAARDVHGERISNIYDVVKLLLHLLHLLLVLLLPLFTISLSVILVFSSFSSFLSSSPSTTVFLLPAVSAPPLSSSLPPQLFLVVSSPTH